MSSQRSTPAGTIAIGLAVMLVAGYIVPAIESGTTPGVLWLVSIAVSVAAAVAVAAHWTCRRRRWWPLPDAVGFRIDALIRWWTALYGHRE